MKNRETLDLKKTIGGGSIGYDHFRHVYEFIQALYHSLDTKYVDYDMRTRDSITKDNFEQKQQDFKNMIIALGKIKENIIITITAKKTYQNFETNTSIQRELHELLKHEENHYRYNNQTYQYIPQHTTVYSLHQQRDGSLLDCNNIQNDIKQDIKRYQSIPIEFLSEIIQIEYHAIIDKMNQLDQYKTNDLLIFNDTITSVSNEYYKIEEELVHLLYDIRLFIENNQQDIFNRLIEKDQSFGMARSTLIHIDS